MKIINCQKGSHRTARVLRNSWMAILMSLFFLPAVAQKPEFQKWNIGAAVGINALSALTAYPTLRGHYKNFGLEIFPYTFSQGIGLSYQYPIQVFQKVKISLDGAIYANRQNDKYIMGWPFYPSMYKQSEVGALAGPSIYFLKRFNVQIMGGFSRIAHRNNELLLSSGDYNELQAQGSLSLEFRLFQSFAQ